VFSPFFGFPFFPFAGGFAPFYPYYSEPIYSSSVYSAPAYVPQDQSVVTYDSQTDALRAQIQQLSDQIQQLQADLAARTQQQPQAAGPPQKPPVVVLILKDGRRINAPGYALIGSTLWILDANNASKISINDVDADATQQENAKRGINIMIPKP